MAFHQGLHGLVILLQSSGTEVHNYLETSTNSPILVVFFICEGKSIRIQRANERLQANPDILLLDICYRFSLRATTDDFMNRLDKNIPTLF